MAAAQVFGARAIAYRTVSASFVEPWWSTSWQWIPPIKPRSCTEGLRYRSAESAHACLLGQHDFFLPCIPRVIRKSMCRLGFTLDPSNWQWQSEAARVSLDVRHRNFPSSKDGFAHALPESWRRRLFALWQSRSRRDSFLCRLVLYSEQSCKSARGSALKSRSHFSVLSGLILLRERLLALRIASVRGAVLP